MTVILANGDFPLEGGEAWHILADAERVVACDGAADAYMEHFHRPPTLVVGDMDSFSGSKSGKPEDVSPTETVAMPGQDDNDLAKAVRVCHERGWKRPVILGATGKRDDHAIGNIMRAFEYGLEVVTDHGRFTPVSGAARFRVAVGTPISVFATDPATRATSRGLEWPLDGISFRNLYCATLNRACATTVEISADRTIFAYIPFDCGQMPPAASGKDAAT